MSDSPVLSYKKPSLNSSRVPSQTSTPLIGSSNNSSPSTPTAGTRKISSRRKALQEFYNISHNEDESDISNINEGSPSKDPNHEEIKEKQPKRTRTNSTNLNLENNEDVTNFIKTSNIEDILKLRNSLTNKLNSHAVEKKTIIYENYYELIRLSQTLHDISNATPSKQENNNVDGLGIFSTSNDNNEKSIDNTEDYLNSVLTEFSDFINNDAKKFDGSFEDVVKNLQAELSQSDSTASINVIPDNYEKQEFPDNVDITGLIKELNFILNGDKTQISQENKSKLLDSIQTILEKLSTNKDELLILQLNSLKQKFL
ncbi:uncharacterized protein RJT21DRAFT_113182 [Scheffersomyces amazonensis]|uniref:uncharacterized protein n=1 Tax=Scheffersomyces amazonensis TaxID=1078765 RepID=UPI00315DC67F